VSYRVDVRTGRSSETGVGVAVASAKRCVNRVNVMTVATPTSSTTSRGEQSML
jgi:hypothetical protein